MEAYHLPVKEVIVEFPRVGYKEQVVLITVHYIHIRKSEIEEILGVVAPALDQDRLVQRFASSAGLYGIRVTLNDESLFVVSQNVPFREDDSFRSCCLSKILMESIHSDNAAVDEANNDVISKSLSKRFEELKRIAELNAPFGSRNISAYTSFENMSKQIEEAMEEQISIAEGKSLYECHSKCEFDAYRRFLSPESRRALFEEYRARLYDSFEKYRIARINEAEAIAIKRGTFAQPDIEGFKTDMQEQFKKTREAQYRGLVCKLLQFSCRTYDVVRCTNS